MWTQALSILRRAERKEEEKADEGEGGEERGGGESPWESWGTPGREPDWLSPADSTAGEGADFFLR